MKNSSRAGRPVVKLAKADRRVEQAMEPIRSSPVGQGAMQLGKLGDQPELRLLSGGILAAGLLLRDRRLFRAGARMLLAHELATLAKDVVKRRIDRTRPRNAATMRQRQPRPGNRTAKSHTSFPSGHSAGAMAVARAAGREYPAAALPALVAAGVVAAAQVPRRAHYASDVVAGLLVGLAAEAASALVFPDPEKGDQPSSGS